MDQRPAPFPYHTPTNGGFHVPCSIRSPTVLYSTLLIEPHFSWTQAQVTEIRLANKANEIYFSSGCVPLVFPLKWQMDIDPGVQSYSYGWVGPILPEKCTRPSVGR
jgi:hypothetical protein